MPYVSSYVTNSLKSSCNWRQSWIDLKVRYMMLSSAKSQVLEVTVSGRSLINIRKSKGPRTVPWGTPLSFFLYILPGARFRALSTGVHCTLQVAG